MQGLNLQVARHSIFGFLGPNGAGKSTAIKLLLGLIRPTNGRAAIFITGFGIGFILAGLLLKGFIPLPVLMFTPWLLPDLSAAIALQQTLPDIWFVPLIATGCGIVVFTAVALWRFSREEF